MRVSKPSTAPAEEFGPAKPFRLRCVVQVGYSKASARKSAQRVSERRDETRPGVNSIGTELNLRPLRSAEQVQAALIELALIQVYARKGRTTDGRQSSRGGVEPIAFHGKAESVKGVNESSTRVHGNVHGKGCCGDRRNRCCRHSRSEGEHVEIGRYPIDSEQERPEFSPEPSPRGN